jgi:hypothetical protein
MSRAPHAPDDASRKQVEAMAGYGITEKDIATVLGIDPKTLRKHYRHELDVAHIKANSRVAESLFKNAIKGNVAAQIWWSKTQMGWSEKLGIEHSGALQIETTDAKDRLAHFIARRAAGGSADGGPGAADK